MRRMAVAIAACTMMVLSGMPAQAAEIGIFRGDATFFDPGLGACGTFNSASELIAALPAVQFDPSPGGNPNLNKNCGKRATVTRNGKSVTVTFVDRCASCKRGDIDLSPAAFNRIAKPEEGRVKVTRVFISLS